MKSRQYVQTTRAESAAATASRIVEAFLSLLMEHWYDEITLEQVARGAGVTVQTVVRRFGGKDGLLGEAVKVLALRINARRSNPEGDVGSRVRHLLEDYEETGDAVIRLLALEPRHPALGQVLDFGREQHRLWVSQAFQELLLPLPEAPRQQSLDGLVLLTDVYSWKLLRRDMGRSLSEAADTMENLIRAWLAQR